MAPVARRRTAAPTRRVNRGSGHSYYIDGQKVVSVSNIKDALPKNALIDWAARMGAEYVSDNWDELADMKPSARYKAVLGARWATTRKATIRGTQVHGYAQQIVNGTAVDVPAPLRGYARAAASFLDKMEVEPLLVETSVFSRRLRFAGTPDLFGRAKSISGSGKSITTMIDYKTSEKSPFYLEAAVQLGAYSCPGNFYLGDGGEEISLPHTDELWIVHLREDGTWGLRPVTLDREELVKLLRCLRMTTRFLEMERNDYFGEMTEGSADADDIH